MPTNRQPRSQKKGYQPRGQFDKVYPDWTLMLKVNEKQFIVKTNDEFEGREELQVSIAIYPGIAFSLSQFTVDELDALAETFRVAFELARPGCIEADRLARESYESGGDDFRRLYRQPPHLAARKRVLEAHGACLQGGPAIVVDLDGRRVNPTEDVAGDGGCGDAVADGEAGGVGAEDDEA